MVEERKIYLTQIRLNGHGVSATDNNNHTFEIVQRQGRKYMVLDLSNNCTFEVDIRKTLSDCIYSKWDSDPDALLVIDFSFILDSVPFWMQRFSNSKKECIHHIKMTVKVKPSKSSYNSFTGDLLSILTPIRCKKIENEEILKLWESRCDPIPIDTIKTIKFRRMDLPTFSSEDVKRLKGDRRWLSDTHISFSLQHWFRHYGSLKIWGNTKILLLDTTFWPQLSSNPEKFTEKWRSKIDMVNYDYVVMPMFEVNHWKLGIIENPGEFLQGKTGFYILDSLPNSSVARTDGRMLQKLLLKHFPDKEYLEGRLLSKVAQVPYQKNEVDCGCFIIFFGRKFFSDPETTISLIKTSFKSDARVWAAWGLYNDVIFIRREIRTLLLKYVCEGDAEVEYN